jgi:hypothetical protein
MIKSVIRSYEVGSRFREGDFKGLLGTGKHWIIDPLNKLYVRVASKRDQPGYFSFDGMCRYGYPAMHSIVSISFGCKCMSSTSRSDCICTVSDVPVRGIIPTSMANRKMSCAGVQSWRCARVASCGLANAPRLAVNSENPW